MSSSGLWDHTHTYLYTAVPPHANIHKPHPHPPTHTHTCTTVPPHANMQNEIILPVFVEARISLGPIHLLYPEADTQASMAPPCFLSQPSGAVSEILDLTTSKRGAKR